MHAKFCMYFLLQLCCFPLKKSFSVELTPDTVSVCPGELVVFKCTTSTTLLHWSVTLNDESALPFYLDVLTLSNNESVNRILDTKLVFRVEWISLSPPCSTFMTNASLALHNAQVRCSSTGDSSDTSTIVIRDNPAITSLNITKTFFGQDSAIVLIEWNDVDRDQSHNSGSFLVTITPPVCDLMSYITINTSSYQFTFPYNSQHTITVTATNCAGNTSTLNKTFNFSDIVQCQQPNVTANISVKYEHFQLEGSQVFFSCPNGQALSNRDLTSATCTNSGDYVEDDTASTCGSNPFLMTAVIPCTLIIILLVGIIGFMSVILILKGRFSQGHNVREKEGNSEVGDNAELNAERNQSHSDHSSTIEVEAVPGSGKLTPNASYELTRVPRAKLVEMERNPAYIVTS